MEISRLNSKFTLCQAQAIAIEGEKSKVTKQTREREREEIKSNQIKYHRLPFSCKSFLSVTRNYWICFNIVEN